MSRSLSKRSLIGTKVGGSRAIDELGGNRLAFADLAASAVLGHGDGLVEGLFEQHIEILGSARPASRIAGLTLGETGMPRRLAIADLVVLPLFTRHRRSPCRRRGRQNCGRLPNGGRCRRSVSASGG